MIRLVDFSKFSFLAVSIPLIWLAQSLAEPTPETDWLQLAGFTNKDPESARQILNSRSGPPPSKQTLDQWILDFCKPNKPDHLRAKSHLVSFGDYSLWHLDALKKNSSGKPWEKDLLTVLDLIRGKSGKLLLESALRLAASQKDGTSTKAIIQFAPFSPDEQILQECHFLLDSILVQNPQVLPTFLELLDDPHPLRRSLVGEILIHKAPSQNFPRVIKLLDDPNHQVATKVVLALLQERNQIAIPYAMKALDSDDPEIVRQVENNLMELAGEWAIQGPLPEDTISKKIRRSIWEAWWKSIRSKDLLHPLRIASISTARAKELEEVIQRSKADSTELPPSLFKDINPGEAGFLLHLAGYSGTLDKQLEKYRAALEKTSLKQDVTLSLLNLIQLSQPEEMATALIGYLPSCPDFETRLRISHILASTPAAKATASTILSQKNQYIPATIRAICLKLIEGESQTASPQFTASTLANDSIEVRVELARDLLKAHAEAGVQLIIESLPTLPKESAEHFACLISGLAQTPLPDLNLDSAKNINKTDLALKSWWTNNKTKLNRIGDSNSGPPKQRILVVDSMDPVKNTGRVFLMSPEGRTLWEISNLNAPNDAHFYQGRVLISEAGSNRITVRDIKGNILWEKAVQNPFLAKILPNGNYFIAGRNAITEINRQGKEVFHFPLPTSTILASAKTGPYEYGILNYSGVYLKIDTRGKELSKSAIPFPTNFGINGGTILADEHILVSIPTLNKIMEYTNQGHLLHEYGLNAPGAALKTDQGNILAPNLQAGKLVETRNDGKIVWESPPGKMKPVKVGLYP